MIRNHPLFVRIADNSLKYSLWAFAACIVVGGPLFSFIQEDVNLLTGVYWATVTAFTVGFGDVLPTTDITKAFTIVIIPLASLAYLVLGSHLTAVLVREEISPTNDTPELHDDVDHELDKIEAAVAQLRLIEAELKRRELELKNKEDAHGVI